LNFLWNKFPQIKKRDAKIDYEMTIYTNYSELFKNLKIMEEKIEPLLIMIFFDEDVHKNS
jgi:hypothetical protein